MQTTERTIDFYLDRAKERLKLPSDRALAQRLNITSASVNGWRRKKAWPADEQMAHLAALAGEHPVWALIELNSWRAKSPEVKNNYKELLAKIILAGGIILLLAKCTVLPGTDRAQINPTRPDFIHYAIYGR